MTWAGDGRRGADVPLLWWARTLVGGRREAPHVWTAPQCVRGCALGDPAGERAGARVSEHVTAGLVRPCAALAG